MRIQRCFRPAGAVSVRQMDGGGISALVHVCMMEEHNSSLNFMYMYGHVRFGISLARPPADRFRPRPHKNRSGTVKPKHKSDAQRTRGVRITWHPYYPFIMGHISSISAFVLGPGRFIPVPQYRRTFLFSQPSHEELTRRLARLTMRYVGASS